MKKILLIFGTRPEAIKMVPIIKELKKNKKFFDFKICVTGQHKKMLNQVLEFFEIKPHFNINVMQKNQSLESLTSKILKLKNLLFFSNSFIIETIFMASGLVPNISKIFFIN